MDRFMLVVLWWEAQTVSSVSIQGRGFLRDTEQITPGTVKIHSILS